MRLQTGRVNNGTLGNYLRLDLAQRPLTSAIWGGSSNSFLEMPAPHYTLNSYLSMSDGTKDFRKQTAFGRDMYNGGSV